MREPNKQELQYVMVDFNDPEIAEAAHTLTLTLINVAGEAKAVAVLVRAATLMLRALMAHTPYAQTNRDEIRRLLQDMQEQVLGETAAPKSAPLVH